VRNTKLAGLLDEDELVCTVWGEHGFGFQNSVLLLLLSLVQEQQSVEDVLAAANALLSNLQSGEPSSSINSAQASIEELQGLGYVCDESGCMLVLPGDSSRDESEWQ
jgi:hypothetical protein